MIELGEEQILALSYIKQFIKSKETIYSLIGSAGTGKSFLIQEIVKFLESESIPLVLCAPTHKAKVVLERFTGREGITIHKLLSLTPNIQIMNLDFRDLRFVGNNKKSLLFPTRGVVICDESSMVNDELFDLIVEKAKIFEAKLIFVGDIKQIRPVNASSHSKVFNVSNKIELTKIYRQNYNSGLAPILLELRENSISNFKESLGEEGSLYCYNLAQKLFEAAVPCFKKAIETEDILETKLLAYTNNRVNAFNKKMREILFPGSDEYYKQEIITSYENGESGYFKYWNSMDYIIKSVEKKDIKIPNFMTLPGYSLKLYDTSNDILGDINILSDEVSDMYLESLGATIEDARLNAIAGKGSKASAQLWGKYYKIISSFTTPKDVIFDNRVIRKKTFDYGYATTVHKAQGSSINNVFIDMKDISICRDPEEFRQLQYVALSRAKINAYLLI